MPIISGNRTLHPSLLSPYLNIGLLTLVNICQSVAEEWTLERVPINAAEGGVRQVIGWREYVCGLYFRQGAAYAARNALGHIRDLPALQCGG